MDGKWTKSSFYREIIKIRLPGNITFPQKSRSVVRNGCDGAKESLARIYSFTVLKWLGRTFRIPLALSKATNGQKSDFWVDSLQLKKSVLFEILEFDRAALHTVSPIDSASPQFCSRFLERGHNRINSPAIA
jgi:hypothetical protein